MSDMSRGIDERALFSDESSMFRIPEEPNPGDMVTIRFRTRKGDADRVTLYMQFGKAAACSDEEAGAESGEETGCVKAEDAPAEESHGGLVHV